MCPWEFFLDCIAPSTPSVVLEPLVSRWVLWYGAELRMFPCSEICDKIVSCVPPLWYSSCSGETFPKGTLPEDIVHLQSPSRTAAEQAGLSWVEETHPRQRYLKGVPRHITPALAALGNPPCVLWATTFLFKWPATHFQLEFILSPFIADFCQHGPLIQQVLLFSACLPKQ